MIFTIRSVRGSFGEHGQESLSIVRHHVQRALRSEKGVKYLIYEGLTDQRRKEGCLTRMYKVSHLQHVKYGIRRNDRKGKLGKHWIDTVIGDPRSRENNEEKVGKLY